MKFAELQKWYDRQSMAIQIILILSASLILVGIVFAMLFPKVLIAGNPINFNHCHFRFRDDPDETQENNAEES